MASTTHTNTNDSGSGTSGNGVIIKNETTILDKLAGRLSKLASLNSTTGTELIAMQTVRQWLEQECFAEIDFWKESNSILKLLPNYPFPKTEREDIPMLCGRVIGKRNEKGVKVMIATHIDAAPSGDVANWTITKPYSPLRTSDKLYGCGVTDMKGGLISGLEVFERIAKSDRDFAGEVYFLVVSGGQDGGIGTLAAFRRGYTANYCIIPSASALVSTSPPLSQLQSNPDAVDISSFPALGIMHPGSIGYRITLEGISASVTTPHQGESPIDQIQTILDHLHKAEKAINQQEMHPLLKELQPPYPTTITHIQGGHWHGNIIDKLTIDIRTAVVLGETIAQAQERFKKVFHEMESEKMWFAEHPPKIEPLGPFYSPSSIEPSSPLVKVLAHEFEKVVGKKPKMIAIPYGSSMAHWNHIASTPTIIFGPGDFKLSKTPNEFINLHQMHIASEIIYGAIMTLLTGDLSKIAEVSTVSPAIVEPSTSSAINTPKQLEHTQPTINDKDSNAKTLANPAPAPAPAPASNPPPQRGWFKQLLYDISKI